MKKGEKIMDESKCVGIICVVTTIIDVILLFMAAFSHFNALGVLWPAIALLVMVVIQAVGSIVYLSIKVVQFIRNIWKQ